MLHDIDSKYIVLVVQFSILFFSYPIVAKLHAFCMHLAKKRHFGACGYGVIKYFSYNFAKILIVANLEWLIMGDSKNGYKCQIIYYYMGSAM